VKLIKDYMNGKTGDIVTAEIDWDEDTMTLNVSWETEDSSIGTLMKGVGEDSVEDFADGIMWDEGFDNAL